MTALSGASDLSVPRHLVGPEGPDHPRSEYMR